MLRGLDSKPPTDEQLAEAKARGFDVWALYHGVPGDGIAEDHLAADSDFARVRAAGLETFAYVSGNEDPAAIAAWSAQNKIHTVVDVENFIRNAGPWLQPWLNVSGSGAYGNADVHVGITARGHILADYPGYDPQATWMPGVAKPAAGPYGLQWKGSTTVGGIYGIEVDLSYFDDEFLGLFQSGGGSVTSNVHLRRRRIVSTATTTVIIGIGASDDALYANVFDYKAASPAWSGTKLIAKDAAGAAGKWLDFDAAASDEHIDVAGRGLDNSAWHLHSSDGGRTWSAQEGLGGVYKSPLILLAPGRPEPPDLTPQLAALQASITNLKISGLTPDQDAHLAAAEATVAEMEAQLAAGLKVSLSGDAKA